MKCVRPAVLAVGMALALTAQAQLKPGPRNDAAPRLGAPAAAPASAPAAAAPRNPEMERAGQTAALAWLLLLDRKDWGSAWDASSAVFRQNVPLAAWMDGVPKLREPFGAFVEREPLEVAYRKTLAGRPDGDYVTVLFASKFAKKADVQETVTSMREPDGRWRVTGYTAR
jgi:hypothetical protein